jgi:hypothetical protein
MTAVKASNPAQEELSNCLGAVLGHSDTDGHTGQASTQSALCPSLFRGFVPTKKPQRAAKTGCNRILET